MNGQDILRQLLIFNMLLTELVEFLPNKNLKVVNDGDFNTFALCGWDGTKQLVPLFDETYVDRIFEDKKISCILISDKIFQKISREQKEKKSFIITNNSYEVFYELHLKLFEIKNKNIARTKVHPNANVHESVFIDNYGVEVGENSIIGPNCTILRGTLIKKNCKIYSNVILGEDGFEVRNIKDKQLIIPHLGNTIINDNVDIQAGSIILKPVFNTSSKISESVKIGSNVMISHGVRIGKNTQICASSTICGNVVIGKNCYLGPNSTISNNLKVGNNSKISIGSTVVSNVPSNKIFTGYFSIEHQKFLNNYTKLYE